MLFNCLTRKESRNCEEKKMIKIKFLAKHMQINHDIHPSKSVLKKFHQQIATLKGQTNILFAQILTICKKERKKRNI